MFKYLYFKLRILLFPSKLIPLDRFKYDSERKTFLDWLKRSSNYLEYGGGWSTIQADRLMLKGVTVETDKVFLNLLRKQITVQGSLKLIYANIGFTKSWGYPAFFSKSKKALYLNYIKLPFDLANDDLYDLIYIDGRFRKACFLYILKTYLERKKDCTIIFDDYFGKFREYNLIESFFLESDRLGNAAIIAINSDNILRIPSEIEIMDELDYPV